MRLLIAYPQPNSYSETFIHNHIKYLNPVATITDGWLPYLDQNSSTIFHFPFSLNVLRGAFKKYLPNIYFKIYQQNLKRYLIENKIEIVLAEYGITASNMIDVCTELNIPLVAHYHGFDAYEYKTIDKYKSAYLNLSNKAAKIIVVSEDMKNELIQLGMDATKMINHPYGVDVAKFKQTHPAKNKNIIISVGRFTGKKAPQLVIKSFAVVTNEIKDAELWMVGGGEKFEECKSLIEELGLQEKVKLWGVKKPEEISELLAQAKIFVQHSLRPANGDSEGTPNTVLEASSCGLPIVSTLHAGIKEAVIHNQSGYLVNEGDYENMAKHLITLLNDNDAVERMGNAAREHMEKNYKIENKIESLRNILKSI